MHVLAWDFRILCFCGIWRSPVWANDWRTNIYRTYTIFTIFLTYTFTLSEFIEFSISTENLEEAANNCLMLLTMLGICYKIANIICKHDEIVKIVEILKNDLCRPRGVEEMAIQKRFDERGRYNTLFLAVLVETAVIAITVGSLLGNVPQRTLPFRAWLPFEQSSNLGFWIAFIHQLLAHAMAANIGTGHDTLFHGLMTQACAQLNILKSRLRSIPMKIRENGSQFNVEITEREEVKKCVLHHEEIFKFVERSNDIFNIVILIQFSVSTIVICVSTYTLSKTSFFSAEFTFVIMYLGCMLVQIFLMCWHGNEVIAESVNVGMEVYEMDWDLLRQSTRKDLQMIMIRTLHPIRYTSGHVITLSLDAYNSLMKLSFSMYNLLQRTSS